jgi:small subunit ribosomal protein S5
VKGDFVSSYFDRQLFLFICNMAKGSHKSGGRMKEKKEFEEEVLEIARVTRVVKGGRRLRFRATVIIGNQKGKVGIGIGKANEVSVAIKKAVTRAKRKLIVIPIVNGDTIPFDVSAKFKAAQIMMMPASEGTGIKAGSSIRKILALAGIKNVLSKSTGRTKSKINIAKATMKAIGKFDGRNIKDLKKIQEEVSASPPRLERRGHGRTNDKSRGRDVKNSESAKAHNTESTVQKKDGAKKEESK